MRLTQLGSLAALAGLSQAFLLPPSISTADVNVVEAIPFESQAVAEGRVLEVDCPGCPIGNAKENAVYHAESMLRFNVAVEHDVDGQDRLMVNDNQIFPVSRTAVMKGLHADQVIKGPDGTWAYAASPELGYSMSIKPYHDGNQDLSVFAIHFRIMEVANQFIRGIPAVEIKLLRTPSGKLMIADSHISKAPVNGADPNCTSLVCRWKAILAGKMEGVRKGCGRKKGGADGSPRPHGIKVGGGRPHHVDFQNSRPYTQGSQPHRPHHNTFGRFVRKIVFHVIVPMGVGLAVGITASIVGMIVGHLIIFVWRMLFRRGERSQCSKRRAEATSEECDDESKAFLEAQGPPPVYEDAVIDEKTEDK